MVVVDALDWVVKMVSVLDGCCEHEEQLLVKIVMSSSSGTQWLCGLDGVGVGV